MVSLGLVPKLKDQLDLIHLVVVGGKHRHYLLSEGQDSYQEVSPRIAN